MNFADSLSYLLSLGHETLTIKLGLANTEALLAGLANPHRSFRSAQIAGTNGKGSTARMLESICRQAGIRVGLFTSPHLISITERVRINGAQISESDFARLTEQVKTAAEKLVKRGDLETLPTFFEQVTAIALLAFREANIELAILETGLGGRLDSTTAAGAGIVAIAPIAMDHEEYLGHTIAEIAAEKAAIIRPGVTAIVAPQRREAIEVIARRCREVGVTPELISPPNFDHALTRMSPESGPRYRSRTFRASQDGRMSVTFETPNDEYQEVTLGLRGRHQVTNAAIAIALAEALRDHGFRMGRDAIVKGLEEAKHPGRLEWWEGEPTILFDGAHNPAAAQALRDYLDEFVSQPITMVFGAMRDKALKEIISILFPIAREVILTELDNPRAATLKDLKAAVPIDFDRIKVQDALSVKEALGRARRITEPTSLILVTGSLYLIGAVQKSGIDVIQAAH